MVFAYMFDAMRATPNGRPFLPARPFFLGVFLRVRGLAFVTLPVRMDCVLLVDVFLLLLFFPAVFAVLLVLLFAGAMVRETSSQATQKNVGTGGK